MSYLEVLISLAIMAMIGALTVAAIGFARNTGARVARDAAMESTVVLRVTLRAWLEASRSDRDHSAFIAKPDRFGVWLDQPPAALPHVARLRVTVALRPEDTSVALVMQLVGLDGDGNEVMAETRAIYAGLEAARLHYLPRSSDPTTAWVDALEDGDIPALIRVEARWPDGGSIPPFIVQPAVAYRETVISLAAPSPPG